jgi:DNA integrity scanning protein DisA with diadenylate cyclase activity
MLRRAGGPAPRGAWTPEFMREELTHALVEALYELEVLPPDADGALIGLYAVMDDLRQVLERTERLDAQRSEAVVVHL